MFAVRYCEVFEQGLTGELYILYICSFVWQLDGDVDDCCSSMSTLANKLTQSSGSTQFLLEVSEALDPLIYSSDPLISPSSSFLCLFLFQEVFSQTFDSALQSLVSDFLSRIEQLFPIPDFKQVLSGSSQKSHAEFLSGVRPCDVLSLCPPGRLLAWCFPRCSGRLCPGGGQEGSEGAADQSELSTGRSNNHRYNATNPRISLNSVRVCFSGIDFVAPLSWLWYREDPPLRLVPPLPHQTDQSRPSSSWCRHPTRLSVWLGLSTGASEGGSGGDDSGRPGAARGDRDWSEPITGGAGGIQFEFSRAQHWVHSWTREPGCGKVRQLDYFKVHLIPHTFIMIRFFLPGWRTQSANQMGPLWSQPILCTEFPTILRGWLTSVLTVANVSSTDLRSVCLYDLGASYNSRGPVQL